MLLAAALGAAACTEKLGSGTACPALCPIEEVGIVDTTIQGVVLDTTVYPGPPVGSEGIVLLLTRTDGALDLRGVFRFDSLPRTFRKNKPATVDTADYDIKAIKGAKLVLQGDTSSAAPPLPTDSVTIVAYDVDTSGVADSAVAPIAALFTPAREIGRRRIRAEAIRDTFSIPLSDSAVLAKVQGHTGLRVGVRIESGGNTTIAILAVNGGGTPRVYFAPSATTDSAQADSVLPPIGVNTLDPADDPTQVSNLRDYTLVVKGNPPPPPDQVAIGGIRGRRVYMNFDIPKRLLDSTQIVRATLRLNQVASPLAAPTDTGELRVLLGTALSTVTDITKRSLFHEPVGFDSERQLYYGAITGLRAVKLKADTTATRSIEVAPILRQWAGTDATKQPHSIVLSLPTEGTSPIELRFSSLEAAANLRPTLQITYVPRNAPGIP